MNLDLAALLEPLDADLCAEPPAQLLLGRANVRVVALLIDEFPRLLPMRARLIGAVRSLETKAGYRQMMYSPEATPIAHSLLDKLPELHRLKRRLFLSDCL